MDQEKIVHEYKRGQAIFYEGNPAFAVYCVYSGRVKLYKVGKQGGEQIIRLMGPGDVMGYRSMLAHEPHLATAEAIERTIVCTISKSTFLDLVRRASDLSLSLLVKLAQQLRTSEEQILGLTQESVRQRTARLLLFLLEGDGKKSRKGTHINVPLLRREMAQMIGTTPETLSRSLRYFVRCGIVRLTRSNIFVTNRSALQQLVHGP